LVAAATAKVLLVDDDPDVLESMHDLLRYDNVCDVVEATSGQDALGVLDRERVDAVVSDFRMPGMDGCVLLRKVQEDHPDIARILVTAYPNPAQESLACSGLSVAGFLHKPVDPEQLKALLRSSFAAA
jgi:CheY-like chemotaxis protein